MGGAGAGSGEGPRGQLTFPSLCRIQGDMSTLLAPDLSLTHVPGDGSFEASYREKRGVGLRGGREGRSGRGLGREAPSHRRLLRLPWRSTPPPPQLRP